MNTTLILSSICLPADVPVDWANLHAEVGALTVERYRSDTNPNTIADRPGITDWDYLLDGQDPSDPVFIEDGSNFLLDELQVRLHNDLTELQRLYEGAYPRDYERIRVAGVDVMLAGGDPDGSAHGSTYNVFQRLHSSGVLHAAGVLLPTE